MKRATDLILFALLGATCLLLDGCLIKRSRAPTHFFVLAPSPASGHAPDATQPVSLEFAAVSMPDYLLRESLAVRKSPIEIGYRTDALWAERLDHNFRRTLADNLSRRLPSAHISLSASRNYDLRLSIDVKQFDVDTQGRGTLIASWQLTARNNSTPLKTGQAHLTHAGPSPHDHESIIATLSALCAQFSDQLAEAIRSQGVSHI